MSQWFTKMANGQTVEKFSQNKQINGFNGQSNQFSNSKKKID